MKCEDFRQRISQLDDESVEMQNHLADCAECNLWLEKELASPPEGITPASWLSATARCQPDLPLADNKAANSIKKDEEEDFWAFFSKGMKYGAALGLALVLFGAIVPYFHSSPAEYSPESWQMQSFIDVSDQQLPTFFDYSNNYVTFYDFEGSQDISFLENHALISFIDETKEDYL